MFIITILSIHLCMSHIQIQVFTIIKFYTNEQFAELYQFIIYLIQAAATKKYSDDSLLLQSDNIAV